MILDRPDNTDMWGISVLKFHWKWSEHECRQLAHMRSIFNEVFRRVGSCA
ncbi:MAG: hypothetical protein ABSH01_22030 [Terriglobia bacterium]|jgi:hypothetical protein